MNFINVINQIEKIGFISKLIEFIFIMHSLFVFHLIYFERINNNETNSITIFKEYLPASTDIDYQIEKDNTIDLLNQC